MSNKKLAKNIIKNLSEEIAKRQENILNDNHKSPKEVEKYVELSESLTTMLQSYTRQHSTSLFRSEE